MIETTLELTETTYQPLSKLSKLLGVPQAYLRHLSDAGQLPYLEAGRKRVYCLSEVEIALSGIAQRNMKQPAPEAPIDFTEFSLRAAKVLKLLRIGTWEQLAALPAEQLLAAPNVGHVTLREVQTKLAARQQQGSLFDANGIVIIEPTYDGDEG